MKQIVKFAADDGTEFHNEADARNHDALCATIIYAKSTLPKSPKSGSNQFVQHNKNIFLNYQRGIVELFQEAVPYLADNEHVLWALNSDRPAGMTLIGRYIDDAAPGPIRGAWNRIMCTDKFFREWGQPFYAIQADKQKEMLKCCSDSQ